MAPFTFHAPTQVSFGLGARHQLPETMAPGSWGVISSPSVRALSGIAEVLDHCAEIGKEIVPLGDVSPNPRLSEVEASLEAARSRPLTGIVAVGGGSVLDAAKLLRVALEYGASGREALDDLSAVTRRAPKGTVKLIAVPTTAGTGAEVSRGSIITDDTSGVKRAARGQSLIPDSALIDPELTLSLPPRRTAETGFDVIAHAIETFLSRVATPLTDILARAALAEVPSALLMVLDDAENLDARSTLAFHSWLMGYNLAHASTCLPHRLQYPVGSETDTSHQIGLAALYPSWLAHVEGAAPKRTAEVSRALSDALGTNAVPLGSARDLMTSYLERTGLRCSLSGLGLSMKDIPKLTASVTGRTDLDPLDPDTDLISTIFRESLDV